MKYELINKIEKLLTNTKFAVLASANKCVKTIVTTTRSCPSGTYYVG